MLYDEQGLSNMAIGERIRYFRNLRGMTQKNLGMRVGFPERNADTRMGQYETGSRTPKTDLVNALADVLDVSPQALDVPDIDSYLGLMHTFFAIEDIYGIRAEQIDGELCLTLDKARGVGYAAMYDMINDWRKKADKLRRGEITKEEYDKWRYTYPQEQTPNKR